MSQRKNAVPTILVLLAYSFIIMLFYSQSSWLYLVNTGTDPQTIFTVGREMLHGMVPYRDLLEQKGPILYFINAVGALISPSRTIHGIYIIESLFLFWNLSLVYKIAALYVNKFWRWISVLLVPVVILASLYFKSGDLAEEFVTPLIMLLFYRILQIDQGKTTSWVFAHNYRGLYLEQGAALAIAFWIKYSLIGPWVAFFIGVLIIKIYQKEWKKLLFAILWSLLGFLVVSALVILYFVLNNSVSDLFEVYFGINMQYYQSTGTTAQVIMQYFIQLFGFPMLNLSNAVLTIFIIWFLYMLFFERDLMDHNFYRTQTTRWLFVGMLVVSYFMAFTNANYLYYYYFLFTPFIAMAIITAVYMIAKKWPNNDRHQKTSAAIWTAALMIFFFAFGNTSVRGSILFPKNEMISVKKDTNVPYETEFAKIINRKPGSTMLNFGSLDNGVYLAANKQVPTKYFARLNIRYQPMIQGQDLMVKNREVDFVVIKLSSNIDLNTASGPEIELLRDNYHIIKQRTAMYEGGKYTNYLLAKNN